MSPSLRDLKKAAADLSATERAELAEFLLQSLDDVQEEGWDEAWREELTRRAEEIRSGKVKGIPAEEVLAKLRERYP